LAKRRRKRRKAGRRKTADSWFLSALARGLAFFLGAFSLLSALGDLLSPGFDVNHWWIDLRPMHSPAADIFLAASAVFLIAYSVRPVLSSQRRILTYTFLATLLFITIWNAVIFYTLVIRRMIRSGFPVAFSVFVAAAIGTVLTSLREQKDNRRSKTHTESTVVSIVTVLACLVVLPFAQMFCSQRHWPTASARVVSFTSTGWLNASSSRAVRATATSTKQRQCAKWR
jgi:multisubunit Na+/H+ antiporter MnhB subunit